MIYHATSLDDALASLTLSDTERSRVKDVVESQYKIASRTIEPIEAVVRIDPERAFARMLHSQCEIGGKQMYALVNIDQLLGRVHD